eukprot:COSAG02_NODE_18989_length_906_cov_5.825279_1_plen_24_part_10
MVLCSCGCKRKSEHHQLWQQQTLT